MLLNYHELTMDEPKNSRQKKLQFRVICMVMATSITYSLITSGALRPVECTVGEFPGGEFLYKTTGRDYAASMSLLESIAKELTIPSSQHGNIMYNLFLDDPLAVNGRKQRFATGILLNDETIAKGYDREKTSHKLLQEINPTITKPTEKEINDLGAVELWPKLKYHTATLPATKAVVVEYMFSNGFVSALLHSYKVFPTIRRYAKEQHGVTQSVPVVLTTCFISENRCLHYVPLPDSENVFRLGNNQWDPKKDGGGHIDWKGVRKMILKIVTLGQLGEDQDEYVTKTTTTEKDGEGAVSPPPPTPKSDDDEKTKEEEATTTTINNDDEKEAPEESPVVVEETTSSESATEEQNQQEAGETVSEEVPANDQEEEEEVQADEPATETTTETTTPEPQVEQQEQQYETTTTPDEPPVQEEETEQEAQEEVQEATREESSPRDESATATHDYEAKVAHETNPEEPVENADAQQQHTTADDGVHHESPPVNHDNESPPQRDEL